jgi:hypothetical protein
VQTPVEVCYGEPHAPNAARGALFRRVRDLATNETRYFKRAGPPVRSISFRY